MSLFTKLCRLCTCYKGEILTLNNRDSDNITFLNKLNEISPGILEQSNELPNGICATCISQLNDAYKFLKKCSKSQGILKQHLKQLQKAEAVKESILEKIEKNEANLKQTVDNNINAFEFIKVEQLDDEKLLDENNTCKIEENELKLDDNITIVKEEPIDCKSEIDLGNIENMLSFSDNSETAKCDLESDIIIKEEKLENEVVDNKSEIITESSNELTNDVLSELSKTNENQKSDDTSTEKCKMCGKFFSNKLELKLHSTKHKETNKYYKCKMCFKVFMFKYTLEQHIRTHTNEKPFRCEMCEKSFSQNGSLKIHLRTHTNEKPFTCDKCDLAFTQRGNLNRHILKHTNEK